MPVHCHACGFLSQDPEFCDRCNADLAPPAEERPPRLCPLPGQMLELSDDQRQRLTQPGGAVLARTALGWRRIHWLPTVREDEWLDPLQRRLEIVTWALPPVQVIRQDEGAWALVEATGDWVVPWTMPASDPLVDLDRLLAYLTQMAEMLTELHRHGLVWLPFDPVEIERSGRRLRITNMDLAVFRFGECPDQLRANAAFVPPEISSYRAEQIGPRTDVYHLALCGWYWLARRLPDGFRGAGLEAFGHDLPPLRVFAPGLLEGIEIVLRQGLSVEPEKRFTSPQGLVEALREAVDRARGRRKWTGSVRWEIGQVTRVGQAKEALGKANEDQVLVRQFADPDRALAAVADGISTCHVGSGQLASMMTMIVLENELDATTRAADFPGKITRVCRRGTQALLDWALEKGYRQQLAQGRDLMGTTLVVGWLEGRELLLANLGDSRAYLIDGPLVEQLTVDGDLGSHLLTQGTPPEELSQLGMMAKALRECVGGCTVAPDGSVELLDDACVPTITRWPLLPGDILVLCSDGLVEDGAFLDEAALGELVGAHRALPAQELAELLVDAADGLQRLPSPLEPEGFGDNITCIVIKVLPAASSTTPVE